MTLSMAGDFGVDLDLRRGGEGWGEVVELGVEAATDRFFVDVGELWALPVLGDVCAVAARAYDFGFEEATDNVPVLSDAVSVVVSVVVEGDSGSVPVVLIDSTSASWGVVVDTSSSMASDTAAFHLQNAKRRAAMRLQMPRNCQRRRLRSFRETVLVEVDVRTAVLVVGLRTE